MNSNKSFVALLAVTSLVSGIDSETSGTRQDIWSLSRSLRAGIVGVEVDPLGSVLKLLPAHPPDESTASSYLLARVGKSGRWQRLSDENAIVTIAQFDDGTYTLQLKRIQSGIVRQGLPDEIRFEVKRGRAAVLEELTRQLLSGDEQQENPAVNFLSHHLREYADQLDARLAGNERGLFLLSAARAKAQHGGSLEPAEPPDPRWLVREEDGFEVWDFSAHPELNPRFSKDMLFESASLSEVRALTSDGQRVWFTHSVGVGVFDPASDELRLYGAQDGLPGAPKGGVRVAINADVYAGTERGLAVYEPERDRFYRVPIDKSDSFNIQDMEVDSHGRLWFLSRESGGGVRIYDGKRWFHHRVPTVYGMTRDAAGDIWLGAKAEHGGVEWENIFPSSLLERGAKVSTIHDSYPFADYLGRLFIRTTARFPYLSQYAWPGPKGKAEKLTSYEQAVVIDRVNQEIWIERDGLLVNDTRTSDPNVPSDEKWVIPSPKREKDVWHSIYFVAKDRVYLGTKKGLYVFDGSSWHPIQPDKAVPSVRQPSWPRWPQRHWTDGIFYRPITARRIEIVNPYPVQRAPRGRFYEIIKRDRKHWLKEETDDGQTREYEFQPPFRYEPSVLFADADGHVWAAGTHYLYRFDGEEIVTYTAKETEHLDDDHIYSFAATPQGEVWVGTEGGLFLFKDGRFVNPPKRFHSTIFSMVYDLSRERLVVSTSWHGFHIKQGDDWTHYKIPYRKNGRHDQMVRCISIDADGTLWLATNSGVVSFSEKDRRWVKFGNEFTEGVVLARDGTIYVDARPRYVLRKKGLRE